MKKIFLPFIIFIAVLLRLPSLFEPNWYGDEGIYQVIGKAMAAGRPLYTGIWDNKPPLLYIIYMVFHGEQFLLRLFSLVVMVCTIIAFFFLARKLLQSEKNIYLVTSLFAILFALPLLEGNIANAENFMLLPIICGVLLVLNTLKEKALVPYLLAGLLIGLAFLIKIVAIFDLGALFIFLFVLFFLKNREQWFMRSLSLGGGFLIPVAITIAYFFLTNGLSDFFIATFSQNVSYVGAGNKLFVGQGLLLLKLFLLGSFCLFLFFKRKLLSQEYLFIYIWLAFSIFNAFFGGRPWIHYLLTLLPSFCLLIGLIAENKALRLINVVLCLSLLLLIYKNFWVYGKTFGYYKNFAQFTLGQEDERAYRGFFDWFVNRDYDLTSYIQNHSKNNDTLFIWGDNAQIYALSNRLPPGRYTVAYHVTFYPRAFVETKEAIDREKPSLFLVMRDDFPQELLGQSYELIHTIDSVKIYARRI